MFDKILALLCEARTAVKEEQQAGKSSRELSIVLTEIDTAILWRQEDLRIKAPVINLERSKTTG